MGGIFISYRRSDAQGEALHLFDDLKEHFGTGCVFMDVATIQPGRDFRVVIEDAVSSCDVLIAMIGDEWLEHQAKPAGEPDFVELEIAAALKRDIPVIPVLVQEATPPAASQLSPALEPLAWRNAFEVRHTRWDVDVHELKRALDTMVSTPTSAPLPSPAAGGERSGEARGQREPRRGPAGTAALSAAGERVLAFHARLKEKRLYRVIAFYVLLIGVVTRGTGRVAPGLRLPDSALDWLMLASLAGLPLVVAVGLMASSTAAGDAAADAPARDPGGPAAGEHASPPAAAPERRGAGRRERGAGPLMPGVATLFVVAIAAVLIAGMALAGEWRPGRTITLAVLPLDTVGTLSEAPYLADDLQADLTAQLGRIRGLRITSQRSVESLAAKSRDVKELARRLGVRVVLAGTLRHHGDGLRMDMELVEGETAHNVWAGSFVIDPQAPLLVQEDLVRDIARALEVKLSFEERDKLQSRHEPDPLALEHYRTAMRLERHGYPTIEESREIERLYRAATDRDPRFALALARLSRLSSRMYFVGLDRSPARLRVAEQAVDSALALDPGLPEARLARALFYYWGRGEYELAARQLESATDALPSDPDAQAALGYIYRRLGKWDEALSRLKRAAALDPLYADRFAEIGYTHRARREYPAADAAFRRAFQMDPDFYTVELERGYLWFFWKGTTDTLRSVLSRVPVGVDDDGEMTFARFETAMLRRDPNAALEILDAASMDVFAGQTYYFPASLLRALALRARGDPAAAAAQLGRAIALLNDTLRKAPANPWARISLARAYAAAGRAAEAEREAGRARQEVTDAFAGPQMAYEVAIVHAEAGMATAAIGELSRLLTVPNGATTHQLRADPAFDRIRPDPRFAALLRGT